MLTIDLLYLYNFVFDDTYSFVLNLKCRCAPRVCCLIILAIHKLGCIVLISWVDFAGQAPESWREATALNFNFCAGCLLQYLIYFFSLSLDCL